MNCVVHGITNIKSMALKIFRLTPYEWDSPHPCTDEDEELETTINFENCLWHNLGSLMQQGSDIAPK